MKVLVIFESDQKIDCYMFSDPSPKTFQILKKCHNLFSGSEFIGDDGEDAIDELVECFEDSTVKKIELARGKPLKGFDTVIITGILP